MFNIKIKTLGELYCQRIQTGKELNFLNQFSSDELMPIHYLGLNPDDTLIHHNRQFFRTDKNKFYTKLDAVHEPIPQCDLLILNQFFSSLPTKDLWWLLTNIKESKATYLMIEKELSDHDTLLNNKPFYLPKPDVIVRVKELNRYFDVYLLQEIAFLLEYADETTSQLRAQIFTPMQADFKTLHHILGDVYFKEFLMSFKMGWQRNIDFISIKEVNNLLRNNHNQGYELRNHYYRILFRREFETIQQTWDFYQKEYFFQYYLILLNYINFLLFDETYKLFDTPYHNELDY